jgi:hypothetical protein
MMNYVLVDIVSLFISISIVCKKGYIVLQALYVTQDKFYLFLICEMEIVSANEYIC